MPGKKQNRRLSRKQALFVKEYKKGTSALQSALKAGYSPATAKNATPNILERHGIQQALIQGGITDQFMQKKLKEGTEANRVIGFDKNGKMKEYPDHNARHKHLDTLAKIRGDYAPVQTENKNLNINLDVDVERMTPEEMRNVVIDMLEDKD